MLNPLLLELAVFLTEVFSLRKGELRGAYTNEGFEPPCRTSPRQGDGTSTRNKQPPATSFLRLVCTAGLRFPCLWPGSPSSPRFLISLSFSFPQSPTSKISRQINQLFFIMYPVLCCLATVNPAPLPMVPRTVQHRALFVSCLQRATHAPNGSRDFVLLTTLHPSVSYRGSGNVCRMTSALQRQHRYGCCLYLDEDRRQHVAVVKSSHE